VRQDSALERNLAGPNEIIGRVAQAIVGEPLAVGAMGDLGFVAEAEQCLAAARGDSAAHDRFDLGECVGLGFGRIWKFRKGAVRAAIAAEIRQRDEDVPGNADHIALTASLTLGGALEYGLPNDWVEELRGKALSCVAFKLARVYRGSDQALRFGAG